MRVRNFGRTAIFVALGSWAVGIGFLLLSWLTVGVLYGDPGVGDSKPEGILLLVFPVLSALSVPMACVALTFGLVGLIKGQSRWLGLGGMLMALPVLLVAAVGLLALSQGGV